MKRIALLVAFLTVLSLSVGCKKHINDQDAIRAGILQHLNGVGTLNMSAMEMNIRSVSITGSQAHADVEFRPKGGDPSGVGMQIFYNLEKRDGGWVVQKMQPSGRMIGHPVPGANSEPLPKFSDIVNPTGTPAPGALPPGHPLVNAEPATSQAAGQDQTPVKKPR